MASAVEYRRGQPDGLLKLCFVEMWERFGFVTTMGMAVLYFASSVTEGGLGWSNADALLWIGYYAALLMTLPMLGGWIADNIIGAKKAILIGGCMMAAGYFALGCLPFVLLFTGIDAQTLIAIFSDADLVLARPAPDPLAWARVEAGIEAHVGGDAQTVVARVRGAYTAQTIVLSGAYLLIALGNGLLKPSISAVVGALYNPDDARRDGGFTLFWTFINAGALLGYVIGGGVGEQVGWNYGYFVAFVGMCAGLVYFLIIQRELPARPVRGRDVRGAIVRPRLTSQERRHLSAIFVMICFAIVFQICHGQLNGLLGLFILQDVERTLGAFETPVLWITSINPLAILLLAPAAALLWNFLGRRGRNPSATVKFVMALALLALAFAILFLSSVGAQGGQKTALVWVALAIVVMSIAEFPLQPIGLSMVTRLAPAHLAGAMIGLWLFGAAISNAIGGNVGALASVFGNSAVFLGMTVACLSAAAALWTLRRFLDRRMDVEDTDGAGKILTSPQIQIG